MKYTKMFIKEHYRFFITMISIVIIAIAFKFTDISDLRIVENPQYDYAQYLIEKNDSIFELILSFESLIDIEKTNYTESEKDHIAKLIVKQNEILQDVVLNPPNESNSDYQSMYDAFTKGHAFYIQGEIMKIQHIYDSSQTESFIMGTHLTNIVGNVLYQLSYNINQVRETTLPYKYGVDKAFLGDPSDIIDQSILSTEK